MIEVLLQQLVNGLSVGFGYALVALGLTLAFGVLHVINFGHGEIVMLGALSVVLVTAFFGVPYLAALPIAALVGGGIGWGVYKIAVAPLLSRRDGRTDALLTTFALGVLLYQAVVSFWGPAPARVDGIQGGFQVTGISLTWHRVLIVVVSLLSLLTLERLLKCTRFGVEMRAVAQSDRAARTVGIDVQRVGASTFVLGAAIAGLGGALLAPITSYSPMLGQVVLLKAFVIVVIGGLGSSVGAVVCALAVGILEAMLGLVFEEGMSSALVYALIVLVLLVRPRGLFGARV